MWCDTESRERKVWSIEEGSVWREYEDHDKYVLTLDARPKKRHHVIQTATTVRKSGVDTFPLTLTTLHHFSRLLPCQNKSGKTVSLNQIKSPSIFACVTNQERKEGKTESYQTTKWKSNQSNIFNPQVKLNFPWLHKIKLHQHTSGICLDYVTKYSSCRDACSDLDSTVL